VLLILSAFNNCWLAACEDGAARGRRTKEEGRVMITGKKRYQYHIIIHCVCGFGCDDFTIVTSDA